MDASVQGVSAAKDDAADDDDAWLYGNPGMFLNYISHMNFENMSYCRAMLITSTSLMCSSSAPASNSTSAAALMKEHCDCVLANSVITFFVG
jgi:hypothetical protein